ncbi:MAG: glycosyltransferase [Chloroflexi bacterium]|nr:glycosyltransferase [Chloroflexota bacterium]
MHTSPLAALGGKETGGMNVYVRELCRALAARGWHIDAFTRCQDPEAPRIQNAWAGRYRVIHIPAGPMEPVDRRMLFPYLPEFAKGVLAFAEAEGLGYDLIHSHYWLSGWAARELQRHWRVPVVQMFHTLGRMKERIAGPADRPEADNRATVEQEVMAFVDRIVAATPIDRQQMIELYDVDPNKIVVIPCGVDLELFRPIDPAIARRELGLEEGRRLILFVGRLDPVKGLSVLLEAMCELTRRMHPCRAQDLSLAVIGGDRESHLEALTTDMDCLTEIRAELGLEDLVIFVGSLDQQRLPYYYSAAEVCVMPSLYESFGMVALEAMACGTPVIASRVGGLQYTVRDGETGFLVPEKNPKALADKLELLLNDEPLRQRLGQQAARVAAEFSWEVVADAMEALYADLGLAVPA